MQTHDTLHYRHVIAARLLWYETCIHKQRAQIYFNGLLLFRNLGYVELMEKMTSLIDRVHKYSNRLQMEESALDDVRIIIVHWTLVQDL